MDGGWRQQRFLFGSSDGVCAFISPKSGFSQFPRIFKWKSENKTLKKCKKRRNRTKEASFHRDQQQLASLLFNHLIISYNEKRVKIRMNLNKLQEKTEGKTF